MRISWCLGLLLAGVFMAASGSYAEEPRPMTDYCNRSDVLYADGSSDSGSFPMLKCGQSSLTYQRSDLSFPLSIVSGGRFSKSSANAACQSAKQSGASEIVSNIASLCNLEMWPDSCSKCN
ncbi:hypothetical protein PsAD2_00515 [Pseudovibrio axinellae]|uniref:Uncharacterized protein n=1 Tax=Pseudovibrio axinellae TaxID=989403 RepID=A0A166AK93_9HYPH|nr:hypothetical protein [Pseudovibrio axinellae]KZL21226.1 hypothetical protein PsAD2_00515 [Pseudovibrio axinellae]SEQ92671.1 hypothetical protein SAMN05421798_105138 [Pseudovibrio axinellae]